MHSPQNDMIISFFCINKSYSIVYMYVYIYLYISYFLYLPNVFWVPQLIPQFTYCEQIYNKQVYASFLLVYWFILLQIHAQVLWWGQKLDLFLVFWGNSILIATVIILVYIYINNVWGFLFSCVLTSICCCCFSW
jgi:hypothetical protein